MRCSGIGFASGQVSDVPMVLSENGIEGAVAILSSRVRWALSQRWQEQQHAQQERDKLWAPVDLEEH